MELDSLAPQTEYTGLIGGISVSIPYELWTFELTTKPSSNVSFYGINKATGQLYVQFHSGAGYMYSNLDSSILNDAMQAESIGSFISKEFTKAGRSGKKTDYIIQSI